MVILCLNLDRVNKFYCKEKSLILFCEDLNYFSVVL